ncbi:phage baseplate assembly protein V [Streptomyces sp. NPDC021093]|uniref:phage baseplate assembly protein V n=1 Tax=Streptomyces sp. NPDC021093 TaxID=3365112 RepID=UPI0037884E71
MTEPKRFFGKYRGTVDDNKDIWGLGRLQVSCPGLHLDRSKNWALPCTPYAGNGVGLFALPPVGAHVWVECEAGDPDSLIWSGCFWGPGEVPVSPAVPEVKVFRTAGVTLTLSDVSNGGGLTVEVAPPAVSAPLKIALTPSGIELSNGSAKIVLSNASVSLNNGALEVT